MRLLFGSLGVAMALALVAPASAQSNDAARARELYEEGARLYNLGQYENALRSFEQAYAMTGAKPLLFNIAQAHRLAGPSHCDKALLTYETYLREDPQASNRIEVEQRIGEMRACSDKERVERERASQAAASPPPPPRPPSNGETAKVEVSSDEKKPAVRPSMGPIIVTGAGGLLAATGGVLYWRARVKFDQVQGTCPCPEGEFSGWQTATSASYVLLAVGGGAIVGGVSWWILDRRQAAASSYGLVVKPGGVSLVGTF
jgi:tetratricopeptide (TPR) repeat protein